MQTIQSPLTVADYCAAMDRLEIRSNEEYQRSNKIWPPAARSFLIESIILGFPLPKIFLFQRTDLVSKKTVKDIVDGQQRSKAIHDFFHNRLALSKKSELESGRGRKYDALDDELKQRFLSYQLSIDLFVSASATEIRQAFRRLNSYTVPLNAEELRHAEYQGAFKWFIYELTRKHEELLLKIGVFTEKQVIRMQDEKLYTDFTYTILHGWRTTKAKELESLYKSFDKDFDQGEAVGQRIQSALDFVLELPEIHNTPLMKPHVFHTLLMAISHYLDPIPSLQGVPGLVAADAAIVKDICLTNLTLLASALEDEDSDPKFAPFAKASGGANNTADQRTARFVWLYNALKPQLL